MYQAPRPENIGYTPPARAKFKVIPRESGGFEIRPLNDSARATNLPLWRYRTARECVGALRRFGGPATVFVHNPAGEHVITKEIEGRGEYAG